MLRSNNDNTNLQGHLKRKCDGRGCSLVATVIVSTDLEDIGEVFFELCESCSEKFLNTKGRCNIRLFNYNQYKLHQESSSSKINSRTKQSYQTLMAGVA